MKKIKWVLLFLILLLAFLLGARMILSGDFFYLFDQARDLLLVKSVAENHTLMLIGNQSGLGGFFHGPLWIYAIAPIYILAKGNPFSLAFFYVGLELFTVFIAFIVGSKLYGSKGGLLIALLIAMSPAIWGTVPNTVGADMEPLVYLGIFYFLIKFLRGNKNYFIPAAFLTGLALQFETASSLVLFPTVIVMFFFGKKAIKEWRVIILSIISFVLSLTTFILFDFRHQFLMTKAILNSFSGSEKGKGYLYLPERALDHLRGLSGVYKEVLFNQSYLMVLLLVIIFVFAAILIFKNKKYQFRKEFLLLLSFPILPFVFFMFYPYAVWPEYVFGLMVPVVLAFFLAISEVWKNVFGKALVLLFFIITFLNVFVFLQNQYFARALQIDSAGSYVNQKAVVEWIYRDVKVGRFGYFVYTPEIFTHGMDYLFYWYGKKNPTIIFENKKDVATYLILYPHMANDNGAYDFWKKNILKTRGKVVLTKVFTGGITVQKLSIDANAAEPPVDPNYYQGLIFR